MATAEDLVENYTRKELGKLASELGLDTSDMSKFPSKLAVAEAILDVKEDVPAQPFKVGKKGVLAKRAAMEEKAAEIDTGAKAVQSGVRAQAKENADAVAKIEVGIMGIRSAMEAKAGEIEAGAKKVQSAIQAQAKENADAVAKIESGIKEIQSAMKEKAREIEAGAIELQNAIGLQMKANAGYVKDFYYG